MIHIQMELNKTLKNTHCFGTIIMYIVKDYSYLNLVVVGATPIVIFDSGIEMKRQGRAN